MNSRSLVNSNPLRGSLAAPLKMSPSPTPLPASSAAANNSAMSLSHISKGDLGTAGHYNATTAVAHNGGAGVGMSMGGGGSSGPSASPLRLKLRLAIHVVVFSVRLRRIARFAVRLTRHEAFRVREAYTKLVRSGAVLRGAAGGDDADGKGEGGGGSGGGGGGKERSGPTLSLIPSPMAGNPEGIITSSSARNKGTESKGGSVEEEEEKAGSPAAIILQLAEALGISDVTIADAKTVISRLLGHHQSSKAAVSFALLRAFAANSLNNTASGGAVGRTVSLTAAGTSPTAAARRLTGGGGFPLSNANNNDAAAMAVRAALRPSLTGQQRSPSSPTSRGLSNRPPTPAASSQQQQAAAATAAASANHSAAFASSSSLLRPGEVMSEDTAVRAIELLKQIAAWREEEEARGDDGGGGGDGVLTFNNMKRLELANSRLGIGIGLTNRADEGKHHHRHHHPRGGHHSNHHHLGDGHNNQQQKQSAPSPALLVGFKHSATAAQIQQQQALRRAAQDSSHAAQQLRGLFEMLCDTSREATKIEVLVESSSASAVALGGGGVFGGNAAAAAVTNTAMSSAAIRPQIPLLSNILITSSSSPSSPSSATTVATGDNSGLAALTTVQALFDTFGLHIDAAAWALKTVPLPVLFPFGSLISQRARALEERWGLYQSAVNGGGGGGGAAAAAAHRLSLNQLAARRSIIGNVSTSSPPPAAPRHRTGSSSAAATAGGGNTHHNSAALVLDDTDPDNAGGFGGLGGLGYFGLASSDWLTAAAVNAIPADFKKAAASVTYADLCSGGDLGGIHPLYRSSSHPNALGSESPQRGSGGGGENGSTRRALFGGGGGLPSRPASAATANGGASSPYSDALSCTDGGGDSPALSITAHPSSLPNNGNADDDDEDGIGGAIGGGHNNNNVSATHHNSNGASRASAFFKPRALAPYTDATRKIIRSLTLEDAFLTRGHFERLLESVPSGGASTLTAAAKEALLARMAAEATAAAERQHHAQLMNSLRQQQQLALQQRQQMIQQQQQQQSLAGKRGGGGLLSLSRQQQQKKLGPSAMAAAQRSDSRRGGGATGDSSVGGGASSTSTATNPLLPFSSAAAAAAAPQQSLAQIRQQQYLLQVAARQREAAGEAALPSHLASLLAEQRAAEALEARTGAKGLLSATNGGGGKGQGGEPSSLAAAGGEGAMDGVGGVGGFESAAEAVGEQVELHRLLRRGSGALNNTSSSFSPLSTRYGQQQQQQRMGATPIKKGGTAAASPSTGAADATIGDVPTANASGASLLHNHQHSEDTSSASAAAAAVGSDDSRHLRSQHANGYSRKILALSRGFSDPRLTALGQRAQQSVEALEHALDDRSAAAASAAAALRLGVGGGSSAEADINNEIDHTRAALSNQRRQLRHGQAQHSRERGYRPAVGGRSLWKLDDHSAFGLDPRTGKPILTRKDALFESSLVGRFNGHPGRRRRHKSKSKETKEAKALRRQQRKMMMGGGGGGDGYSSSASSSSAASDSSTEYDENGRKIVDPHRHVQSVVAAYISRPMSPHRTNGRRAITRPTGGIAAGTDVSDAYAYAQQQSNASSAAVYTSPSQHSQQLQQRPFSGDQFVRCKDLVIPTMGGVRAKEHIRAQSACSDRSRPRLAMLVGGGGGGGGHSRSHSSAMAGLPPRPNSAAAQSNINNSYGGSGIMYGQQQQQPQPLQSAPFRRPNTAGSSTGSGGHRVDDSYLGAGGGGGVGATANNSYHNINGNSSFGNSSGNPVKDLFDSRPQSGLARRLRRQLPSPTIDSLAGTPSFALPQHQRARIMYAATSPSASSFVASAASAGAHGHAAEAPMNRETVAVAGAVLGALQNNKYFNTRNAPLV